MICDNSTIYFPRRKKEEMNNQPLDQDTFPAFAEFLQATRDYATSSGFRFRLSDFTQNHNSIINQYMHLIKTNESAVIRDIEKAAKICEQESIRNVMMTTCKELHLWPPQVEDHLQSMAYTDTSEPLETIAWALFNFQRNLDASSQESVAIRERLHRTASYIVDFAHAAVPERSITQNMSRTGSDVMGRFMTRVKEYTDSQHYDGSSLKKAIRANLSGVVDERFLDELDRWFELHWETVAVGGIAFFAGLAIASLAFATRRRS